MRISSSAFTRHMLAAFFGALVMILALTQLSFGSQQLVEKYQKLAEGAGFTFTYGSLENSADDTFTLHDIVLIRHGVEDPIKIKSMTMTGVKELEGIGLSAERFEMNNLAWDGRDEKGTEVIVLIGQAMINGFYMPDPSDVDAPLFIFDSINAALNDMSVFVEGKKVVELPSATSEFDGSIASKKFSGLMKISQLKIHSQNINDGGGFQRRLESLGYDNLQMDVNLAMDWNMETGRIALTKYEFDIADMGAFDIQLVIGGYTEELTKKMRAMNVEIQSLPQEERDRASQRVLENFTGLSVESMKLSFNDKSITDKIIALQARAQGQPPENMKAMLPIMLNGALAGIQQPELTQKLVSAVEVFLAQPGTISISANPEAPLTIAEIIGLGAALPSILIEKLNINVEAK